MLNIKKVDSVYQFHQYQLQNINANLLVQYKNFYVYLENGMQPEDSSWVAGIWNKGNV